MGARPIAIVLLTCGTLCCSFNFGGDDLGGYSAPTGSSSQGCTTSTPAGCPVLDAALPHEHVAEPDGGGGWFASAECPIYVCDLGWANCNGDCATNLVSEAMNCGACGNACASGTCTEGSCSAVEVLASGFSSPSALAVDATHVYVSAITPTASGVFTVAKGGGAMTSDVVNAAPPTSIAVDATGTYFAIPTDDGRVDAPILVTREAGGPITRLGGYGGVGTTVLLGGGAVLWNGAVAGAEGAVGIFSVPEGGGEQTLVASMAFDPFALATPLVVKGAAMGGGDLFYLDGANVMVLRAGTTTPVVLYTDPSSLVIDLTTDDAFVYWYGLYSPTLGAACDAGGFECESGVRRMPLAGGTVDTLFAPDDGTQIFAAGGDVFTIVGDALYRFDVATSSRSIVEGGNGAVAAFASDGTFVYFIVVGDGTADPTTGAKLLKLPL